MVPLLAGPADPCVAFDRPNMSLVHMIKEFELRVSPADESVSVSQWGRWFWGGGDRAGVMAEGPWRSTGSCAHKIPPALSLEIP